MHLSDELLSSYLDGELSPAQAHRASEHLRDCAACAQALGTFAALDQELAAAPALSCAQAAPFLSAKLDAELGAEEAEIATAHLATCTGCQADVARWSAAEAALKGLPASRPSARVDAYVAALGRQPERRAAATGLGRAWPVPALALATGISLVLVLSLPQAGAPVTQLEPGPLVAAAQDSVFNPNTNTLYYLKTDSGEVIAIDPQTGAQKGVIKVGGKPTALALNLATNTVAVLDSSHRTVHEIDGALTTVQSSTSVDVGGTPTGVQIDTKGNVVVSAVTPNNPTTGVTGVGVIATIDGGTKQIESVREVEVAPSAIVIEPNGKRVLLVSLKSTVLADAGTYAPLSTTIGGIAASFAQGRDDFAVLSSGARGAIVTFGRGGASVTVGGVAHAITSLPNGGFAVLSDIAGRGTISLVNAEGVITSTMDAPANARALTYDASARKFSVLGAVAVTDVSVPATLFAQGTPQPVVPGTTATPLPTAQTTAAPSASPAPSTSPSPTPAATAPPVVVAAPEKDVLVPIGARPLWPGTYFVSVGQARRPVLSASDFSRVWFLDAANRVNALHTLDGHIFTIGALSSGAVITNMAVSRDHVYFLDGATGAVHVLTISTEQLKTVPLALASTATAMAASPDERLWIATAASGLVSYDPRTGEILRVPVGEGLSAVAADALGRIWTAQGTRQAIDVFDPLSGKVTEISLTHGGAVTALVVDRSNVVWVGTDTGQTFALKGAVSGTGSAVVSSGLVGRPITGFVLDQNGAVYFVSRTPSALAYGFASSASGVRILPGNATEPMFDPTGRAWDADSSADGFYVTLPGGGS
jgi:anti-sigma factor RsiW/streptogramin lyase